MLGLAFRLLTGWLYEFGAPDIKYVLMLKNRIYTNESAWSQLVELLSYVGKSSKLLIYCIKKETIKQQLPLISVSVNYKPHNFLQCSATLVLCSSKVREK